MKVLLVDVSKPTRKGAAWYYNLGLAKAANWWRSQGAEVRTVVPPVTMFDGADVAFVSAIFSWHVIEALVIARTLRDRGCRVEVGGPGFFALGSVAEAAGFRAQVSVDQRFDRQPGAYDAVFWSRGCPAYNCTLGYPKDGSRPICLVPGMEGSRSTLFPDVTPAPMILDNNLSALPRAHQEHIVDRTLSAGFDEVDCNSGFEPASFKPETAELWRKLPLVAWRYAYDEAKERKAVLKVLGILDGLGISRRKSHIYCLAGNEPVEACEERVLEIRKWKCVPIVQRRRPLDWTGGPLPTLHDWTEQKLIDFQRWGNRLSYAMPFREYDSKLNHSGVKARKASVS
jgi:hypothetical protein